MRLPDPAEPLPRASPPQLDSSYRAVLAIAVPTTLGNLSVPLLALGDTIVIGQLGQPVLIGAVATAAGAFTAISWLFYFVRAAAAGLTAQAYGAGDAGEQQAVLLRSLIVGAGLGLLLVALQRPLLAFLHVFFAPAPEIAGLFDVYFGWRVLGAPFILIGYAVLGWFVGIGRPGLTVTITVIASLINLALTYLFALVLGLGVAGIAIGTLIVDIGTAIAAGLIALAMTGGRIAVPRAQIFDRSRFLAMGVVNRDLMIRALALTFAFAWFTRYGNQMSTLLLSANGLLMNIFMIGSFFLDGMATAAEQLGGRAVGARRRDLFVASLRTTAAATLTLGVLASLAMFLVGPFVIDLATPDPALRATAREFLPWTALAPAIGFAAFLLDGVYIGATWTAPLRNWIIASVVLFVGAAALLVPAFGNHGLWAAMLILLAARGAGLWIGLPRRIRRTFGQ